MFYAVGTENGKKEFVSMYAVSVGFLYIFCYAVLCFVAVRSWGTYIYV